MAVENRLAALSAVLRAFFASNACFARDERSSKRVGDVGLIREPPKLRLWRSRCWHNGIDNARYCCRVIHAAGERS